MHNGSHAEFPLGRFRIVLLSCASGVRREGLFVKKKTGKWLALYVFSPNLQMSSDKRFSLILSKLLPVLSVPLLRAAATASLAADGVKIGRSFC